MSTEDLPRDQAEVWPFFHVTLATDISSTPGPVAVYAPRGCGKSLLLNALHTGRPESRLVSGRNTEAALAELRNAVAVIERGGDPGTALLDDVDHLVRRLDGTEKPAEETVALLKRLKSSVHDCPICMTTSVNPATLGPHDPLMSDVFMQVVVREIMPWRLEWRYYVKTAIVDRFGEATGIKTVKVFGQSYPFSARFITAWEEMLERVTGGHPALLGPAMALCNRLLGAARPAGKRTWPATESPLEQAVRAELARNGGPYIRQRILALREGRRGAGVFAFLRRVAEAEAAGEQAPSAPSLHIQISLEQEGLAYLDFEEGVCRIVGTFIRDEVLAVPESTAEKRVRTVSPGRKQHLVRIEPLEGDPVELVLAENATHLLRALASRPGEIVPLEELKKATGLTTDPTVRTAVHRLASRLAAAKLEGILENEYGKGYRLSARCVYDPDHPDPLPRRDE